MTIFISHKKWLFPYSMSSSIDFTIIVDFPIKNGGSDLLVYQAGYLKGQSPVDFFVRLPWHWTDSNTGVFIIEIPNSRCFKKVSLLWYINGRKLYFSISASNIYIIHTYNIYIYVHTINIYICTYIYHSIQFTSNSGSNIK